MTLNIRQSPILLVAILAMTACKSSEKQESSPDEGAQAVEENGVESAPAGVQPESSAAGKQAKPPAKSGSNQEQAEDEDEEDEDDEEDI